jgi:RecA/RadA recombinase
MIPLVYSPTKKEMDDDFGKNSEMAGALRAKVAGQCLRRINPLLRKHKAALLIINQVRSKVGVMFGDPRTKAGGGKALLYYCGVSIETSSNKRMLSTTISRTLLVLKVTFDA